MGRGGAEEPVQMSAAGTAPERPFKLGDVRVLDARNCGHHRGLSTEPFVCVEVLSGPVREYAGMDRLPHDYETPEGLGMWRSVAVVSAEALERLSESISLFQERSR
jgi:hypothetical protein